MVKNNNLTIFHKFNLFGTKMFIIIILKYVDRKCVLLSIVVRSTKPLRIIIIIILMKVYPLSDMGIMKKN